ncbi:uncharacterized protein [Choristoneura fumiferana]|uniref:uncharacterized protein n=1 Tax=Choristoneura fumiferana TaxID=7141 RepID=UPI003D1581C6
MRVIWLSLLLFSVKFASGRYIPARRQESDPTPDEPLNEEQILYDNMNILRDLTLTTESIWDFEEVNYDEMIGAIKDEHNDCFGISISCTLAMGQIRPVCGAHNEKNTPITMLSSKSFPAYATWILETA